MDKYALWTYSSDGKLKNSGTSKYLNFELAGDVTGTLQSGEANLFTIRSGDDDTVVFYQIAPESTESSGYDNVAEFEDGEKYVITAENMALISEAHSGYVTWNNYNTYKYTGLKGTAVSINNSGITSQVTEEMLWTAEKLESGYALKNSEGKYLTASYDTTVSGYAGVGTLTVGDEPDAWSLSSGALSHCSSGKNLNWQNSGDIDGY